MEEVAWDAPLNYMAINLQYGKQYLNSFCCEDSSQFESVSIVTKKKGTLTRHRPAAVFRPGQSREVAEDRPSAAFLQEASAASCRIPLSEPVPASAKPNWSPLSAESWRISEKYHSQDVTKLKCLTAQLWLQSATHTPRCGYMEKFRVYRRRGFQKNLLLVFGGWAWRGSSWRALHCFENVAGWVKTAARMLNGILCTRLLSESSTCNKSKSRLSKAPPSKKRFNYIMLPKKSRTGSTFYNAKCGYIFFYLRLVLTSQH